jgi:hypothetical protein
MNPFRRTHLLRTCWESAPSPDGLAWRVILLDDDAHGGRYMVQMRPPDRVGEPRWWRSGGQSRWYSIGNHHTWADARRWLLKRKPLDEPPLWEPGLASEVES